MQSIYYLSKKAEIQIYCFLRNLRKLQEYTDVLLVQATQPRHLGRSTLIAVTGMMDCAKQGVSMVAGKRHHQALSPTHTVALDESLLLRGPRRKIL